MYKTLITVFSLLFLIACASAPQHVDDTQKTSVARELAVVIDVEPQQYRYIALQEYGGELGYSLRYSKQTEQNHFADVYIWPVHQQLNDFSHKDIVYAMSNSAEQDIYTAEKYGAYSNVKLLDRSEQFMTDDMMVTRQRFTFIRNHLLTLSFLYLTEYQGKVLKIRLSLADNEFNQTRKDIDTFALSLFEQIIENFHLAKNNQQIKTFKIKT